MRTMMALVAAATLATTLATPVFAAGSTQVRVKVADIDLSSASGQHALDRRLWVATVALCGAPAMYSRLELADIANCRTEALKAAAPQINAAHGHRAMTVAYNQ